MENKPTLVFIHGYAVGDWYFSDFKDYFEKLGYPCFVPNLPFHDVHPNKQIEALGKLGVIDYVDHLEREITAIGGKPILVGHSLGGLLAQHLAKRGVADHLVLLQPAAPRDISMVTLKYLIHHFKPMLAAITKKPFKYPFKSANFLFFNGLSDQAALDLYHRTVHESGQVMYEIVTRQHPKINAVDIKGKILTIAGNKDRGCTPEIAQKIAMKYGDKSTYKEFVNRGHEIVIEDGWEEVADFIHNWLKQCVFNASQTNNKLTAA